jgi:hypothetical protein
VSVPARRGPSQLGARWETIRYALDSNARTVRLCLILLVLSLSSAVGIATAVLIEHALVMVLTR